MRDEERLALDEIRTLLEDLRGRATDPSRRRQEYVTAGEVAAVNAAERQKNPELLSTLAGLEDERRRLHALFMDGQAEGLASIRELHTKVDRLRRDFSVLDH